MDVVSTMTGNTAVCWLFAEKRLFVTTVAFGGSMFSQQRKSSVTIMTESRGRPLTLAVASLAFRPIKAFMRIIAFMAGHAFSRGIDIFLVDVTIGTSDFCM